MDLQIFRPQGGRTLSGFSWTMYPFSYGARRTIDLHDAMLNAGLLFGDRWRIAALGGWGYSSDRYDLIAGGKLHLKVASVGLEACAHWRPGYGGVLARGDDALVTWTGGALDAGAHRRRRPRRRAAPPGRGIGYPHPVRLIWLALFLVPLSACGIESDFANTQFRCTDGRCPSGYACLAEVCSAAPPGSTPDGAAAVCDGLDGQQDGFDGDAVDVRRWEIFGGTEAGGAPGAGAVSLGGSALILSGGGADGSPGAVGMVGVRSVGPRGAHGTLTVEILGLEGSGGAAFVSLVAAGEVVTVQIGGVAGSDGSGGEGGALLVRDDARWLRLERPTGAEEVTISVSYGGLDALELLQVVPIGVWDAASATVTLGLTADPGTAGESAGLSASFGSVGLVPGQAITCPPG